MPHAFDLRLPLLDLSRLLLGARKRIGVIKLVSLNIRGIQGQEDALAFVQSCHELGVPVALEISRSGNGAHAWVFFAGTVSARDARRLGTTIISHTCSRTRQLKLESYDRLFPNQDTMPKGDVLDVAFAGTLRLDQEPD